MFTGLVKEIGVVKSVSSNAEGKIIEVFSKELISEIKIDDSVSINGACQTAIWVGTDSFKVQTVKISLDKTSLGNLKSGDEVNLELALRLSDRLGGHIVQGHVNDIGILQNFKNTGKNYVATIKVHSSQMKYIVKEGSVTLDGVSLTISDVFRGDCSFQVSIIPHTWENTVFRNKSTGSTINIEVDILGKYIENLLFYRHKDNNKQGQDLMSWLAE